MSSPPVIVVADAEHAGGYRALELERAPLELWAPNEVMALIAHGEPAVVLLDAGYDPGAGLLLLSDIKRLRPEVPVIFLTDVSSENLVLAAFRGGAREYFRKPIGILELQEMVDELVRFRRTAFERRVSMQRVKGDERSMPLHGLTSDLPAGLQRAVRHIQKNLAKPLYLDDIAREACLSRYHFCRMFRKHLGLTPMKFILHLRVERAKGLLKRSDMTVTVVAHKTGFNDLSEFSRQFKLSTGLSPVAYRKSCRSTPAVTK
ncbi:helix-turn-helix domain-containing protein [Geobacter pickeringii]|uniref:AraC family transcriptional regulator n=1 Tax=Geobacter pickeringii TaxID=345632 RepID=A0A0B5B7V7_9BACT|nr:helix-turn-helix domain-containing protein [Geobacter pickeringii]AJE02652.1 hypothetical protein GPICK_04055 [Geobacter pickeringii]